MTGHLLRDPLAHFLLAGAAIWGVLALAGDPVDPAERTIVLAKEQQAALALGFQQTMGRAPTDAELDAQIERWLREEVLYREALRLGLDRGDPAVRRRLAAKMDELAGAEVELAQPSEAVLRQWHDDHSGQFETGGMMDFEQAYFLTEEQARAALGEASPTGQAISLPRRMDLATREQVAAVFGQQFAEETEDLTAGPGWQGPVASGFGWHLVRITRREDGSTPPFEAIRDKVESDWRSRTMQARRARAYHLLREAYSIEIE